MNIDSGHHDLHHAQGGHGVSQGNGIENKYTSSNLCCALFWFGVYAGSFAYYAFGHPDGDNQCFGQQQSNGVKTVSELPVSDLYNQDVS